MIGDRGTRTLRAISNRRLSCNNNFHTTPPCGDRIIQTIRITDLQRDKRKQHLTRLRHNRNAMLTNRRYIIATVTLTEHPTLH